MRLFFLFLSFTFCFQTYVFAQPTSVVTDTRSVRIDTFTKRVFTFPSISFLANFPTARLNNLEKQNDSTFVASISAENYPINPSPWYAFKLVAKKQQSIVLTLEYQQALHRYHPKMSFDGKHWFLFDSTNFIGDYKRSSSVKMKLTLTPNDTLWIAAQPIVSTDDVHQYVNKLAKLPYVKKILIGKSKMGRTIPAFQIGKKSNKKPTILLISRQHPPEVTGYKALQGFLEVLLNDDKLAKWYRKRITTIVVPVMNPDGVDLGHWRHNAGGVDLNRDWQNQHQPETRQVVQFINQHLLRYNTSLIAMIDFHSTYFDIFYVNKKHQNDRPVIPNLVSNVLQHTQNKLGLQTLRIQPTKIENFGVSKNYFQHKFQSEAFVYEMGDDTPPVVIAEKSLAVGTSFLECLYQFYNQ